MNFPTTELPKLRSVYNVDGTANKEGMITHYMELTMQTGPHKQTYRFYLTNLGNTNIILGYPWFTAKQPKIDWAKGWLSLAQLPLIIQTKDAHKAKISRAAQKPNR